MIEKLPTTGVEAFARPISHGDIPDAPNAPEKPPEPGEGAGTLGHGLDPGIERHGIQFDRAAHAVDDLGWDSSGGERCSVPKEDGLLVLVPEGDFVFGHEVFKGTKQWGIVGIEDGARILPPVGSCARVIHVSGNDPGNEILVENIEFHQRGGMQAGAGINITVESSVKIHNCERTGKTPNRLTAGPPHGQEVIGLSVIVENPNGHGTIRQWKDHCETEVIGYPGNAQGISVWDQSKGVVEFDRCSVKNQGEHALYGSKASAIRVKHTVLEDCANTNLRIAGEGSFAENCRIGYGRDREYTRHKGPKSGYKQTKIVRIEDSRHADAGGVIRDSEIYCETDGLFQGALIYVMGNVSGFRVEDSEVRNDSDSRGAVIQAIGEGWRGLEPPTDDPIEFINVDFGGSSANPPIDANRPKKVRMERCSIDMPNASGPRGV